jgi:uncharacterized protein YbjT (DUF2867 family)
MPLDPLTLPGVLVLGGGGTLGEAWLRAVLAAGHRPQAAARGH